MAIDFNNLKPLHALIAPEIREAINSVINRGWFILGPEDEAFEQEFAKYHGVNFAVGVATGTDAIELALRAAGVERGDEVITVSHTAVATVCAVERAGAKPVLVDVDPKTYTMDPKAAESAITSKTSAILPVHLYGHPADMKAISSIAKKHKLLLIEDCAQSHGAKDWGNRLTGTFGDVAAFSFYPTKNMGAYGDGGAVITNDTRIAEKLKRLRNYGQVTRYESVEWGTNSRLDEMQAAILRVKLRHLDRFNKIRRQIASNYRKYLKGAINPTERKGAKHVYHLYVVRHPKRDRLQYLLNERGIGTLIHYPLPVHRQPAYLRLGYKRGSLPITESIVNEILSLPMYIGLNLKDIKTISRTINTISRELDNEKS